MNRLNIVFITILLIFVCLLTGCMSREVRTVISEIDALGEITIESYEKISSATEKYEALTEEDKALVENISVLVEAQRKYAVLDIENRMENITSTTIELGDLDAILDEYRDSLDSDQQAMFNSKVLEDAKKKYSALDLKKRMTDALSNAKSASSIQALLSEYQSKMDSEQKKNFESKLISDLKIRQKVLDLSARIDSAYANITSSSVSKFKNLEKEYQALSSDIKKQITNYSKIQSGLKKATELYTNETVSKILSKANGDPSGAWDIYIANADLFNEEQNKKCLLEIVRWMAFDRAEDKLIDSLLNPRAYYRYGGKTYAPSPVEDDEYAYTVMGSIDCSSTNSFGGTIRKTFYFTVEVYIYPSIHKYSIFDSKIRIY